MSAVNDCSERESKCAKRKEEENAPEKISENYPETYVLCVCRVAMHASYVAAYIR